MDDPTSTFLLTHPNCDICKKPLTRRSVYTDFEKGQAWHVGCYNRTCRACGKRIAPKDRWTMAHRSWHQKCWVKALNILNAREGQPQITWEDWITHWTEFWAPGGTAATILAEKFPPKTPDPA